MAVNRPPKTKMTAEEYFALPETLQRQELINGELIIQEHGMDAPSDQHQQIVTKLIILLAPFIATGELRPSPVDVRVDNVNVVQPDVMWVSHQNEQCVMRDGRWYGPPDLVVEILSPSTAKQDKTTKYDLYEQHGVREYWIVDGAMKLIEVYTRVEDKFARHGVFGVGDLFVSPVLGDKVIAVNALLG